MISLHECSDLSSILDLKADYLRSLIAPMDNMWEVGFTNVSPHWGIRSGGVRAGYYAGNDQGELLQFYVTPAFESEARALFDHVISQDSLTQAVVSTIDPSYLSLCLDVQDKVTAHTYLYEIASEAEPREAKPESDLLFRLLEASELDRTVSFQQACLGGVEELAGCLLGYSTNLIERRALLVLSRDEQWLGLGECRKSDSQEGVVDVGVMVAPAHRGHGWATDILLRLRVRSAICSTTVENVAAQRAITRTGFASRHRIMNVSLASG